MRQALPAAPPGIRMPAAILLFLVAVAAGQAAAKQDDSGRGEAPQRPNIVFIMADDHAVQAVSAYGHAISRIAPTPNIDRIASGGVRFANAFVTNSLCGPSRAAMLTGNYSHVNGFRQNGDEFDGSQPTWPRALKAAGYQTALVGKWHLGPTPEGIDFDYWKIFNDQGEYYNPDFLTAAGSERYEGYASDLVTEFGIDWLANRRDESRPFVLFVHHKAPHRNWMPAPRHTRRYENTTFPVPPTYFDDYEGRRAANEQEMSVYRDMYEGHDLKMSVAVGSDEWRYDPWPHLIERLSPEQRAAWDAAYRDRNDAMNAADLDARQLALWKYQRYLQDYLATIAGVDESVGALLDYLDERGLAENTIVVYTSDQGFYLGEHGWFDKRFMYEESLRTPLVMRWPGRIPAGLVADELVMNIDLAPTMLDVAGAEPMRNVHGESLQEIIQGAAPAAWRNSIYYHYYEFHGFHRVKAHYGVRTKRYKLIHFYDDIDSWEFYDLAADPRELHNAIENPLYADEISMHRAELRALRVKYGDNSAGQEE